MRTPSKTTETIAREWVQERQNLLAREEAGESVSFEDNDTTAAELAYELCDLLGIEWSNESGAMRLDSLAFLATVALVSVPVTLVTVFVGRLAGAVAGVA